MAQGFGTSDLLDCYRRGVFPMAEARDDRRLFLMDPDRRGILPLDAFHIPRRLRKTLRKDPYRVTADLAFNRVMEACSEAAPNRPTTWINDPILNLYAALHREGHAHSLECWDNHGLLVGGLYGVSLGGAFFGESMFSRATDASKIALCHLVARLRLGGYTLLDAQFWNPHLEQFNLLDISRVEFHERLHTALALEGDFSAVTALPGAVHSPTSVAKGAGGMTGASVVQAITQIS
ncbi:MAG: leucyl/phenylalanyl-tRNA--protein transferase [Pseudomonadota bacterium]